MKITFFDTHEFERPYFEKANEQLNHQLKYLDTRLSEATVALAKDSDCVCAFVNDRLDRSVLASLQAMDVRLIALRSAGFNHVDLVAAQELGLKVVRVPEYSPFAVAEFAVTLILALNRKIHKSTLRVQGGNFSLNGLVGFDLHGKTVGVVGMGKIGKVFAKIMNGFGCKVLAFDLFPEKESEVTYVPLDELFSNSDIISLHVPLTPETSHLISHEALEKMKKGVMLINTGRGMLIDTKALITGLKSGHIGYAGLDVYEEEEKFFFRDLSDQVIQDDTLARLLTFPNVILTSHQAFLTQEALGKIATTTLQNVRDFESNRPLVNEVCAKVNVKHD